MASTKKPTYKVETKLVSERKRRRSDLVVMWQSARDVTSILIKELWMTLLRMWELFQMWFSSSERFQVLTWLEKHLPYAPDDFSESWRDGKLLAILLNKLHPGCFPDAQQLDPDYSLRNVYKAFGVLETYFGITSNVSAEEMITCVNGSDTKLFELILQLKRLNENGPENANNEESETNPEEDNSTSAVSMSCIAKGTGLAVGFVGRITTFIVFFASISDLDVVVEIRGPNTVCSEKITKRSPKKKRPTLHWDLPKPIMRSVSCDDKQTASTSRPSNAWEDKLIPLGYEVIGNQISFSYKPKEKGFHRLAILWHGQHVSDSPYSVCVEDFTELVIKDNLTQLKFALGSTKVCERMELDRTVLRLKESSVRPSRKNNSLGKVLSKKIISYVVKINGQDIPVNANSTESLASELLKMDYDFGKCPSFHRRNSWGCTGDAERKRSVIRQFGVDMRELEMQSSQRRTRSLSVNPATKKSLDERELFNILPSRLNIVREDGFENIGMPESDDNEHVFSDEDLEMLDKIKPDEEEMHENDTETHDIEWDGESSCKSHCEDGRCNDTNLDSGVSTLDGLEGGEVNSGNDSTFDEDIENINVSISPECTDSGLNSIHTDEDVVSLNDLTSLGKRVRFQDNISINDLTDSSMLPINLSSGANLEDIYSVKCTSNNRKDNGIKYEGETNAQDGEAKFNIHGKLSGTNEGHLNKDHKNIQVVEYLSNQKADLEIGCDAESSDQKICAELEFNRRLLVDQVEAINCSRTKAQLFEIPHEKISPTNSNTLSAVKTEPSKEDETIHKLRKQLDGVTVECAASNCSANNIDSTADVLKSFEQRRVGERDFLQYLENNTEIEVTKNYAKLAEHLLPMDSNAFSLVPIGLVKDEGKCEHMQRLVSKTAGLDTSNYIVSKQGEHKNLEEGSIKKDDFFQDMFNHTEKEVTENCVKHIQKISHTNEHRPKQAEETPQMESSNRLKSHVLKPLMQFNFKQFNPNTNFHAATNPVKGKIKLWERSLTAEERTSTPKEPVTAEIGVNVKQKLAFWEDSLKSRQNSKKNPERQMTFPLMSSVSLTKAQIFKEPSRGTSQIEGCFLCGKDEPTPLESSSATDADCDCLLNCKTESFDDDNRSSVLNSEDSFRTEALSDYSGEDIEGKKEPDDATNKEVNLVPDKHVDNRIRDNFRNRNSTRSFSEPVLFETSTNPPEDPTNSPSPKSSATNHSWASNDENFEWEGFSTESGSVSFHESSEGEFIDDEIPEKAEYWGDLGGVKGLKLAHVNKCPSREEEMLKDKFQKMKSYPELCVVFGIAAYYGHVAVKNRFEVYTGDAGFGSLSVGVQGFGSDDVTLVSINHVKSGIYEVIYQVMTAGYYVISIRWLDQAIPGNPFVCKVTY